MDIVDKIMAFESGALNAQEVINLFSELVKNGMAWSLQGSYGRTATALIERGYLNKAGEICINNV